MRLDDIKPGLTYHDGKGNLRAVVKYSKFGEVVYRTPGADETRSCWCTTFASWAKGIVHHEELSYQITCSCGNTLDGHFPNTASENQIHCPCGLSWRVLRPKRSED